MVRTRRRALVVMATVLVVLGGAGCAQETDRDDLGGAATNASTSKTDGDAPESERPSTEGAEGPAADGFSPVLVGPIPLTTSQDVASCAAGVEGPAGTLDNGSVVIDRGGESCYLLGPVLATSEVVDSAEAERSPTGQWQVALVLSESGIDQFNQAAAQCFPPGPAVCPTGLLAIVVDGAVQSAPSILQAAYEREDIVISGEFTEGQADDLAETLEG